MVFEVINDRGVSLRPYEILKGKLLGQIDKTELVRDNYCSIWENQIYNINELKEDDIDIFFRYYLKSKFSDTRKDGTQFDGDYHREIFKEPVTQKFNLTHNPTEVKSFLKSQFQYYTNLYLVLLDYYYDYSEENAHVFFNALNEMDGQFLLIMSACQLNDHEQNEKIKIISYEVDRLFSLLQLQGVYDSNSFNDMLYKISSEIRDGSSEKIRPVVDKYLLKELSERRNTEVTNPFQYAYFRNIGITLNLRFKRYFFARIEKFLADNMNEKMKHDLQDYVTKTGAITGFHIEHILSYNDENLAMFDNDEEMFEQERNRLGGILLLKGKDNISSGNETYTEKLKSYANTQYWNVTLREDTYKSKLDFRDLNNNYNLGLESLNQFGPKELEKRQKILFKISSIIWE
ncbi:MAG: HNH endonuclease [Bacteroidetes bacterium]|nr:HNH endonuclease [Bacteroidota bacterium]